MDNSQAPSEVLSSLECDFTIGHVLDGLNDTTGHELLGAGKRTALLVIDIII